MPENTQNRIKNIYAERPILLCWTVALAAPDFWLSWIAASAVPPRNDGAGRVGYAPPRNDGVGVIASAAWRSSIFLGGEMEKLPAVYIVASQRNGTLYVGVTSNLVKRIWQHKNDQVEGFTRLYGVHSLVYFEVADTMDAAISREKQIKAGSRAKKLKLIEAVNPEWNDLYDSILCRGSSRAQRGDSVSRHCEPRRGAAVQDFVGCAGFWLAGLPRRLRLLAMTGWAASAMLFAMTGWAASAMLFAMTGWAVSAMLFAM